MTDRYIARRDCDLHVVRPGKVQCNGVCDDTSSDVGNTQHQQSGARMSATPDIVLDDYLGAPSGIGPLAHTWADKPHRLVYALIDEIERLRAAGDAMADNLGRHVMACGVNDARQALAAWQEARRG